MFQTITNTNNGLIPKIIILPVRILRKHNIRNNKMVIIKIILSQENIKRTTLVIVNLSPVDMFYRRKLQMLTI